MGVQPSDSLRVLVIDDEPAIVRTLCSYLKLQGYRCDGEHDPVAALELAKAGDHHMVITDLVMPDLDGLALVRQLRDADTLAQIIVVTAYSTLDRAVEAYSLGVSDYLLKPFDNLDEVGEVVAAAASRYRRWRKALTRTIDRAEG